MSYVSLNSCIHSFNQTPHIRQFALIKDDKEGWKVVTGSNPSCFSLFTKAVSPYPTNYASAIQVLKEVNLLDEDSDQIVRAIGRSFSNAYPTFARDVAEEKQKYGTFATTEKCRELADSLFSSSEDSAGDLPVQQLRNLSLQLELTWRILNTWERLGKAYCLAGKTLESAKTRFDLALTLARLNPGLVSNTISVFAIEDEKNRFEIAKSVLQNSSKAFEDIDGFINIYGLKDKDLIYQLLLEYANRSMHGKLGPISVKCGLDQNQRYEIACKAAKNEKWKPYDPIKGYQLGEELSARVALINPFSFSNLRQDFGIESEKLRYQIAKRAVYDSRAHPNHIELYNANVWNIEDKELVESLKREASDAYMHRQATLPAPPSEEDRGRFWYDKPRLPSDQFDD